MIIEEIIQILTPALNAKVLTSEQRKAFEEGLAIIEPVTKAQSFVRQSRQFRDYHRRVRILLTYLQTLDIPGVVNTSGKRRVGRPTKVEQAAYAEAKRQKALQEAKRSLFPEVAPNVSVQPLTYNGVVANPNGESIAATMPKLMELRPFLSESLQARVNSVRELRSEMASKAEHAKAMAEANEKSEQSGKGRLYSDEEIAELATRSAEIESDILPAIYMAVDNEIGECYMRLSEKHGDPEYIEKVKSTFNIKPSDLRSRFRPFYEKAKSRDANFPKKVAERIASDRPEVKAARDAAAKHKAEADALIKYITRKDRQATKTRIKGLIERIDKLRLEYSDIVSSEELVGYEAILTKSIEEAGA